MKKTIRLMIGRQSPKTVSSPQVGLCMECNFRQNPNRTFRSRRADLGAQRLARLTGRSRETVWAAHHRDVWNGVIEMAESEFAASFPRRISVQTITTGKRALWKSVGLAENF